MEHHEDNLDLEVDAGFNSGVFPDDLYAWQVKIPIENESSKRKRDTFEENSNVSETSSFEINVCSDCGERNNSGGSSASSSDGSTGIESTLSDLDLGDGENSSVHDQKTCSDDDLANEHDQKNAESGSADEHNRKAHLAKTKVDENVVGDLTISGGHVNTYDGQTGGEEKEVTDKSYSPREGSFKEFDPILSPPCDSEIYTKDEDGDTTLHMAIIFLKCELSLALIKLFEQCHLNTMNHMFQTPLHLAVLTKQEVVVEALLAAHACIHLRDKRGRTPLHIACEQANTSMLRIMLENESSCAVLDERLHETYPTEYCSMGIPKILKTPNEDGQCCIHSAATNDDLYTMKLLLAYGADINRGDCKSGRTALHLATEMGSIAMVEFLLSQENVEVDQTTRGDETAMAIAFHRKHQGIYDSLKANGAKENFKYFAKFGVATAEINKRYKTTKCRMKQHAQY